MKVNSLYLIITIFLLSNCKKTSEKDPFWYDFKGMATLEVNYSNNGKVEICNLFAHKMFPESETNISDTIPVGSGKRSYNLPVSWPQRVTFKISGSELNFILLPGSKLSCNIDFSDLKKTTFSAKDSLSNVNDYLLRKDFSVPATFKSRRTMAVQAAPNLTEFSKTMDALYNEEQQFFNENKDKLPQWFQNYEFWDIRYSDASLRLNSVPQRAYSRTEKDEIPPSYYHFLSAIKVNNDAAKNFSSYYFFLYELFNKGLADKAFTDCNHEDFLNYHLCRADKELTGDVKDLFKAYTIQNVYNYYKKDVAWNYIQTNATIFRDTVWNNQLQIYFKGKESYVVENALAPNFVLPDLQDSLTSLRSLKGNVIVLSFWFSACKPCIEEFPSENALVEKFKNKPVKIVSVCVNTTEEQWRRSSKKYDLKTVNLWANSAWEKTIIEKYDLYSFPKYILIDQNQKISKTDADRPSKGLESQINGLLNKK